MQKWEYLVIETPSIAEMQDFGEEGWELVTSYTAASRKYMAQAIWLVFKRPKP